MSRKTEDRAKEYLIQTFDHARYGFSDKEDDEVGFDLWMEDRSSKRRTKVELKATEGQYRKPSDIFQKLYFSAANEVENFERGHTKVLRVFLGNKPHKVFVFDRGVLEHGARFETEFRAKIVGKINYEEITEIGSEANK
jgi:hypothetical protein